jgi:hypothetical protein
MIAESFKEEEKGIYCLERIIWASQKGIGANNVDD